VLSDVYFFDLETFIWSRVSGTSPGRCAHTGTTVNGKIFIFGGGNGTRCFKDMYIFDAEQLLKAEETKAIKARNRIKVKQKLEVFLAEHKKHLRDHLLESQIPEVPSISMKNQNSTSTDTKQPTITSWLESFKMEKFVSNFIREEIDISTVQFITEDHLKNKWVFIAWELD